MSARPSATTSRWRSAAETPQGRSSEKGAERPLLLFRPREMLGDDPGRAFARRLVSDPHQRVEAGQGLALPEALGRVAEERKERRRELLRRAIVLDELRNGVLA